jgi:diguanylate cyclase (GGDEF)-like protein
MCRRIAIGENCRSSFALPPRNNKTSRRRSLARRITAQDANPGERTLISLKKYLDQKDPRPHPSEAGDDTLQCYRSLLLAVGRSALQGSPAVGADLERSLKGLEHRLSIHSSASALLHTEKQVEVQLQEWGSRTAEHFKTKADEVRELLIALAKTAEAVGNRNQGYSTQFRDLTSRLETIADLDDLTQIRTSVVASVNELKSQVEKMTRDNQELVENLRSEVTTYENRLKTVENLILKDEITGVASRRSVEERMQRCIDNKMPFCVIMIDLNGFKHVNDKYGHLAGDDLLRQFAMELQMYTRSGDMIGRWGGDEFVVLLSSDAPGAASHMDRIREWVFGKYTIQRGANKDATVIHMDASLGMAEWKDGKTMQEVVAEADMAMYRDKKKSHAKPAVQEPVMA